MEEFDECYRIGLRAVSRLLERLGWALAVCLVRVCQVCFALPLMLPFAVLGALLRLFVPHVAFRHEFLSRLPPTYRRP